MKSNENYEQIEKIVKHLAINYEQNGNSAAAKDGYQLKKVMQRDRRLFQMNAPDISSYIALLTQKQ